MLIWQNKGRLKKNLHFLPCFLSIRAISSPIYLGGQEKAEGLFPLL